MGVSGARGLSSIEGTATEVATTKVGSATARAQAGGQVISSLPFFWVGLAGLALVMSLGDRTPLFQLLFYWVPGFSFFKDQERTIFLFALSGSVLAGYGARALLDGRGISGRMAVGLGGLLLAGAAVFIWGVEAVGRWLCRCPQPLPGLCVLPAPGSGGGGPAVVAPFSEPPACPGWPNAAASGC